MSDGAGRSVFVNPERGTLTMDMSQAGSCPEGTCRRDVSRPCDRQRRQGFDARRTMPRPAETRIPCSSRFSPSLGCRLGFAAPGYGGAPLRKSGAAGYGRRSNRCVQRSARAVSMISTSRKGNGSQMSDRIAAESAPRRAGRPIAPLVKRMATRYSRPQIGTRPHFASAARRAEPSCRLTHHGSSAGLPPAAGRVRISRKA